MPVPVRLTPHELRQRQKEREEHEYAERRYQLYLRFKAGFQVSGNGSYWRKFKDGTRVCIYRRFGRWMWVLHPDGASPIYSERPHYECHEDAMWAAFESWGG